MKQIKLLWMVLFAAVVSLSLNSCDDDEPVISDAAPVILTVYVMDNDGNSLLDSDYQNNQIGKLDGLLTYKGKTGNIIWHTPGMNDIWSWNDENSMTRYYLPFFYGVWYETTKDNKGCLQIGEFDGATSWSENFTLEFPEYNKKYDFEMKYKGMGNNPSLKVNGEKVKVDCIHPAYTVVLP